VTLSPVSVEKFGGINLAADPEEVSWNGAIDMLNVEFDRPGRIRSRDGYTHVNGVATANNVFAMWPWDGMGQVLLADQGGNILAYTTGGAAVSSIAGTIQTVASLGTGAAGPYLYYSGNLATAIKRWDGAAFTSPGGMPFADFIAVQPTENRLVAAATSAAQVSRVQFSDAGAPETWTAANYVDLHPNDGQAIQGMIAWRELLFVFKGTRFYVFYGNSIDASGNPVFNYRTVDGYGAGNKSSGGPIYAVAGTDGVYFANATGIFRTTGGPPVKISGALEPYFRGGLSSFFSLAGGATPVSLTFAGGRLFVPAPTADREVFVYDPLTEQWSVWQFADAVTASTNPHFAQYRSTIYVVTGTKFFNQFSTSASDDAGTTITSRYRSGFSDLGTPDVKRMHSWRLQGSGVPTLKVSTDFGALETGAAVTLGTSPAIAEGVRRYAPRGRAISWQVGASAAWSLNNLVANVAGKRAVGEHATA
jgi:hypothetical protein